MIDATSTITLKKLNRIFSKLSASFHHMRHIRFDYTHC